MVDWLINQSLETKDYKKLGTEGLGVAYAWAYGKSSSMKTFGFCNVAWLFSERNGHISTHSLKPLC